jgi:hypothetical protein
LRGAGLTVWFDRDDLRDHETITERLVDGLARSRALLALYSPTYHRRRACQWELASAWLAGAVEAQRGEASRVMVAQCGSALPSGVEVMPPPPTRFVGRTNEMWDLHVSLLGNTTVLSGSTNAAKGGHGLAQVQGCGGMGKTLLATEYVNRFGAAWPGGVFWLRAQGDHTAARSLQEEAYSVSRRILGAEHPDTLGSMHNLACMLWEMGDHQEAISHWETALPGLEHVLGADHPTTGIVRRGYSQAKAALQNTSPA